MTHFTTIRLSAHGHRDLGRGIRNDTMTMELPHLRGMMRGMPKAQVHTLHCLAPMLPMLNVDMLAEFPNLRNIQLCIAGNEVVRHFDFSRLLRLEEASIIAMSPMTVTLGESLQLFNCTPNVTIVGMIPAHIVGNFREQDDSSDGYESDSSTETVQLRPRTPQFGMAPLNLLPIFNACY